VQVGPRVADLTEGEAANDKYYFYDGLQNNGFFQEQTYATWMQMMKLWLVNTQGADIHCTQTLTDWCAEVYEIADDEARGEQVKEILHNCVGRLRCQWTMLRCKNPIPGASAAIDVQSCAYDTEVCPYCVTWLVTCRFQAMISTLKSLIAPAEFEFLQWYNDRPTIEADFTGNIVSTEELDEDSTLPL
jgi:hypothetical protein